MNNKKFFAILTLVVFMMTLMPMAAFASSATFALTSAATLAAGTTTSVTITVDPSAAGTNLVPTDTLAITLPSKVSVADVAAGTAIGAGKVNVAGNVGDTVAATTYGISSNVVTITLGVGDTIVNGGGAATITIPGVVAATAAGTAQSISAVTSKDVDAVTSMTLQVIPAAGNEFTTSVTKDKTSLDADNDETVKFTVYVYDQFYNPVNGANVYFASDRGAADSFVAAGTYTITATGNSTNSVTTTVDGKAEFKVKSLVAGNAKIGMALADGASPANVYQYLIGNANANAGAIKVVGTETVEFVADTSSQTVAKEAVFVRDRTNDADLTPGGGPGTTSATTYTSSAGWGKANKLDYYKIKVKVTNAQGSPVPNQEVQFSVDDADAWFADAKVETDGSGIATAKIYAQKADIYCVTYKTSSATAQDVYVQFDAADVSTITLKSEDNRVLAKDTRPSWKFEVGDSYGNKIDVATPGQATTLVTSIDSVTKPTGATIKKSAFSITADTDNKWIKIQPTSAFTKEGNYVARATLTNGQYAEFSWEIKQQGEIIDMTLKYDETSLPLNTAVGAPTVTWVDADGVEKDADDTAFNSEGIKFTANDYTKLSTAISVATGTFTTATIKDYVGELVITAYDNANKLSASFAMNIGRELASMVAEVPEGVTEVGQTAVVPVKFVDILGNQVATGGANTVTVSNAYATVKPGDATVSIEECTAFAKKIKETGAASFEVSSTEAGDVTVFVAVTVGTDIYSHTFTVAFGEPAPEIGADNVTMFIGSTGYVADGAAQTADVAPFIQDGRTFVPVRMVSEALGAEVAWDEATQTVTLTRPDKTITLTIGSNVLAVSDGSSVVADVAPFIKDGRTVLPFRAIGEAFGATVDAVFAADGSVSAVTFAQ